MRRSVRQTIGVFLALLAILAQLTGAVAVPSAAVSLADATVLCAHDASDNPPAHHPPACPLCVFCHNAAAPVGLPAVAPALPALRVLWIARAAVSPPATAPPPRVVLAAQPRGPPPLV